MKVGVWAVLCGVGLLPEASPWPSLFPDRRPEPALGGSPPIRGTRPVRSIIARSIASRARDSAWASVTPFTASGRIGAEAPDWGLTAKESYTATLQVAGTPYTATGRALTTRTMGFNVAPELFGQLKSGLQLTVAANQKRYTVSLDGVEAAAGARARVRAPVRSSQRAPAVPPPALGAGGLWRRPS